MMLIYFPKSFAHFHILSFICPFNIPVKIINENKYSISYFVYNNLNVLSSLQYINGLEYADVTPVFKQDDKSHTVKPQDCFTD